jgi:hypothetical protein
MEWMRPRTARLATLLALLAPVAAAGQPSLGLRIAVAPALGSAVQGVPISDAVRLQVPLQLDALWDFGPWAVGAYGSWGWGQVGSCDGSCDGSVLRAGIQGTRAFSRRGGVPWAGLAAGYEWATEERTRGGHEETTRWRGFELFQLQGGMEWRLARAVALGPYALVGLGRYTDATVDTGVASQSVSLPDRALHAWIHLGVRGRVILGGSR